MTARWLLVLTLTLLPSGPTRAQAEAPPGPGNETKLLPSDGAASDFFGISVSVSGDTALVGAYLDDDNGSASGSAYIFERVFGAGWIEQAKLLASDGAPGDRFGVSVSVSGDTALVGAFWDDDNGSESGSAYVFVESDGVWTEQAKLLPSDGALGDNFGYSVSVSGDTALVGAYNDDDNGIASGSAYVFVESGGVWIEQPKLTASDGAVADSFGNSVSLSGDTALVGAWLDDDKGNSSGSAYVFRPPLGLSIVGSCPGPVTAMVSDAVPNSEVAVVAAANNSGFTKGSLLCNGTVVEIGEPFQLPPLWIIVDGSGSGSGNITLQTNRCWMGALALADCSTSEAVLVP